MPRVDVSKDLIAFDDKYRETYPLVCGIDEAGRGPLAGPVVCASVIFDKGVEIAYVNDSKKLTEKRREALFDEIMSKAKCVGIGMASAEEIDEINILNATKKAFAIAVNSMDISPDIILADAITIEELPFKQVPIIKGDAKSFSIAAASIVAKVTRDRLMKGYGALYHGYNFESHKGYGTKAHYDAIRELGPSPIHRLTFLKKMH